jgi:HSP20 family protein
MVDRPSRPNPLSELVGEFPGRLRGDRWQPAVDVFETEKAIVVRVELAGVRSSQVKVSVDGEWLRIRGERMPTASRDVERLHQMEIAFGPFERSVRIGIPFERSVRIGIPFERDQVVANLEEGFLSVVLPKREPRRRRIETTTD